MSITFIPAFTETPVVEFYYPVDNLQPLFDDYKTWSPNLELNGLGYENLTKRLTKGSDQACSRFEGDDQIPKIAWNKLKIALEKSKFNLVDNFLKIDTENRWPNIPKQISDQIVIYRSVVADMPGYAMEPHIDNRSVYAAGYLNVFDNDPVTVISTQKKSTFGLKKTKEYRAPGEKGRGAIWLNTDNSWHWVNQVTQDRRVVMISFQIVPWG
jgi:hypothetical protein